jgi:hypothetical protein
LRFHLKAICFNVVTLVKEVEVALSHCIKDIGERWRVLFKHGENSVEERVLDGMFLCSFGEDFDRH